MHTPSPGKPSVPPKPVPAIPGPLPPPQEQVLSPIPEQFDWMSREVRPNPLLEALLDLQERPPQLFIAGSLAEEYSDNFFQMARDRQDEYRTRLGIGTVYRLRRGPSFISLANSLSVNYQARSEQTHVAFANLALNAGYQLPQLSLALSESFVRDDRGRKLPLPTSASGAVPSCATASTPSSATPSALSPQGSWHMPIR